ncbi:SRPBCC family protein [Actinophytocola sediminis]
MRVRFRSLAVAVATVGAAIALVAPAQAVAHAGGHGGETCARCGGVTVDQGAPVIARARVFVRASSFRLWRLHTAIDKWDSWIPEITPASKRTPGPLRPGSVFDWSPQNMRVTSTVRTVRPLRCIAWAAPVDGIDGVHLWTFTPVRGGVIVTTEESWAGAPVEADVPGFQHLLQTGLDDWVLRIKETAEAR